MKEIFAWVDWYQELVKTVAEGSPERLAERAKLVKWLEGGKIPPLLKYGDENIDPFSFVYTIAANCRSEERRSRILRSISEIFRLEAHLPVELDDAFIFPQGLPNNAFFHQDGKGNPKLLWQLFRQAALGADSISAENFEGALEIGMVAIKKLTQALTLINPEEFAPFDDSGRPLLELLGMELPATPSWNEYRKALERLRGAFPGCALYEINLFAYLTGSRKLKPSGRFFQVSTDIFYDGLDHWDEFDSNNWVRAPGPAFNIQFGEDIPNSSLRYPLNDPRPGDIVLVRTKKQGKGIGVIWKNDYQESLTEDSKVHVVWINKNQSTIQGLEVGGNWFSQAHKIENAFRQCAAYQQTFTLLEKFNGSGRKVLTRKEVFEALSEYDDLGAGAFLALYGPGSKTRWIVHDEHEYDLKAVWRSAIRRVEGGKANPPDSSWTSDKVQRQLEDLGFQIRVSPNRRKTDQPLNQILYGPPGTGKTWQTVNIALKIVQGRSEDTHELEEFNALRFNPGGSSGNIAMVTFHQNFAYEDFVEGIRPVLDHEQEGLRYELHEGLFKLIANAARERAGENFVLIIDEINRGNVARIFGELITLIEESRRSGNIEATSVTLPYSKENFAVPNNLFLIGTMNTADRSIQLLDTALRRRFEFVEMMPNFFHKDLARIEGLDCGRMLQTMNERIALLLDREHQIGHTYLLDVHDMKTLADRFRKQIFPLLQEYFFDDWSKIKAVLGGSPFVVQTSIRDDLLEDESIDETTHLYERLGDDDAQWESVDAYRAIYEKKAISEQSE